MKPRPVLLLSPLHSLCLLVCCLLLAQRHFCTAQPIFHSGGEWNVSDLTILRISSSQCRSNAAGSALDCVLPALLTVTTTAVPASVSSSPYSAFVLNFRYLPWLDMSLPVALVPHSNTTWSCELRLPGYVRPALNASLAVTLTTAFDYTTASPAFTGLSILNSSPPQLTSVAGCTGSGHSTVSCRVDSDELLLYGSGLNWLGGLQSYTVEIGPGCSVQQVQQATAMYVFNDSVAAYRLTGSYSNCAYPQSGYSGGLLNFSLNVGWYTPTGFAESPQFNSEPTEQLAFSFAILPPPEVDWFSVDQCDETLITDSSSNSSYYAYTSCNVSGQGLGMTGRFLYANVSIGNSTVGWYQAPFLADTQSSSDVLLATLPLSPQLEPNVLYDVRVVNDGGQLLLHQRLSYSNVPLVAAIDKCSNRGAAQQLGCGPGDVITLRGAQFPLSPQTVATVIISTADAEEKFLSANCSLVSVLDRSTLTCVLPSLQSESDTERLLGSSSLVQATFHAAEGSDGGAMSGAVLTNALQVDCLFTTPGFPYVTSVRGCDQQFSPRSLAGCQSGAVVSVIGAHLDLILELGGASALSTTPSVDVDGVNGPASFPLLCQFLGNVSSGGLQCQLPKFDATDAADGSAVQEGVAYHFYIAHSADLQGSDGSNQTVYYPLTAAFDVQFSAPDAISASTLSSGGVAGVVIGALAAVIATGLVAVLLLRRWRVSKARHGHSGAAEHSGRGRGVWLGNRRAEGESYAEMELETEQQ